MSEKDGRVDAGAVPKDGLPAAPPKPAGNPVFRMMGLPNIRPKLPSRKWLIFLSITGSFTTAVLYDRYHKKKAQQRWCNIVSHIAQEPLPPTQMPRRITIFLSAPPGDSLRAAREHFHEYIKPVLVAGAMDWDVIEGRREGDVRVGLAEKIRKRRSKFEERTEASDKGAAKDQGEEGKKEDKNEKEDLVQQLRDTVGVKDADGVQGDLIIGRHTWKEYVRGLHEGWLGPLNPPPKDTPSTDNLGKPQQGPATGDSASPTSDFVETIEDPQPSSDSEKPPDQPEKPPEEKKKEEKSKQPIQTPPYILTSQYPSATLASSTPDPLPPATVLPFPHLLGFLNTPVRIYRFLNRRHLANDTGREVAALVLASHTRAFKSSADPGLSPSTESTDVAPVSGRWEQEELLEHEERDWHQSAWKRYQGEPERILRNQMVIEPRIGNRMRRFELGAEDEQRAMNDEGVDPAAMSLWAKFKDMAGLEEDTSAKGWEHGFVESETN
ncbi:MAG: hypothetical protein Q9183_002424 [Haloplaca sp. 2 TL-2023]